MKRHNPDPKSSQLDRRCLPDASPAEYSPVALLLCALWIVLCAAVVLAGCQTIEPSPTPTPTRTPILPTPTPTLTPTATPTLTPSPTMTPSPTVPPDLVIPPEVRDPPTNGGSVTCPPLPADLYFLRDASLWVCLAEGGGPELIPVAPEAESQRIVTYQITQDQRYVAYVTEADELFVLDRALWQQTPVPTSGQLNSPHGTYFALTADGTTLFYLGWGVQPSSGPAIEEPGSASLLAIDATAPTRLQRAVALCKGRSGHPCGGFLLSPDESQAAYIDALGIWSLPVQTSSEVDITAANAAELVEASQLGISVGQEIRFHSWSPDGKWLLLEVGSALPPSLLLLSTSAESVALNTIAPATLCTDECVVGASWDQNRLWYSWDTPTQGCFRTLDTAALEGPLVILKPEEAVCQVGSSPLHPRSPFAIGLNPDGGVTFLQSAAPGIWSGLYAYAPTGDLTALALLPEANGALIWSPGGDAFLYIDAQHTPAYLGTFPRPALWHIRELLDGAHSFTWGYRDLPPGDE